MKQAATARNRKFALMTTIYGKCVVSICFTKMRGITRLRRLLTTMSLVRVRPGEPFSAYASNVKSPGGAVSSPARCWPATSVRRQILQRICAVRSCDRSGGGAKTARTQARTYFIGTFLLCLGTVLLRLGTRVEQPIWLQELSGSQASPSC